MTHCRLRNSQLWCNSDVTKVLEFFYLYTNFHSHAFPVIHCRLWNSELLCNNDFMNFSICMKIFKMVYTQRHLLLSFICNHESLPNLISQILQVFLHYIWKVLVWFFCTSQVSIQFHQIIFTPFFIFSRLLFSGRNLNEILSEILKFLHSFVDGSLLLRVRCLKHFQTNQRKHTTSCRGGITPWFRDVEM